MKDDIRIGVWKTPYCWECNCDDQGMMADKVNSIHRRCPQCKTRRPSMESRPQ